MIESFASHSETLSEAKKENVVFAFGRLNPPTIGHGVLVDKVISEASKRNADHFVFVTQTQDSKKNPLTHAQKVMYLKQFFPKGNFPLNQAKDPYDAVLWLCAKGYKNITMVAGSDRIDQFKGIAAYKGKVAQKDPKKRTYSFDTFEVVMAGEARDDEAQGAAGMSASKMRAAAFDGDYTAFEKGVPGTNKTLKKNMYKAVRKGLGLSEQYMMEAADEDHKKVTILALTSSDKDLSDSVEKMEKICKKRGIEFYAVKTSKAQVDISNVVSKKITIKNYDGEGKDATIVPGDTVCIVRGGVMNTQTGVAVLEILQNNGVFMINEKGGMELCANKLQTAIALKKHGLPHPRTAFVVNEANIESAVKEIGGKFPVIAKTLTGAEGIGVSKIESMESLKSVLQTLWKYGAEVIIQEFLPNFKNDVRSIVLNGKIFACAKRDKAPKDFRTNIARGSKGGSHQLSEEEVKLVEQAARVSKCYYVGIDHVINDGKPYIIEMNASPGSGNIYYRYYDEGKGKDNVKGEELIEDFLDYILNKAHWKLFSNLAVREPVIIDGVKYTAKVDTGNSGYNMMHGEKIKDNGDHTVSFTLPSGKRVTKKIVSRITVKSGIGEKTRMVVLMDIQFHGKKFTNIKFSIGDRSHMSTKVLLGLQFLSKTGFTVDPANAIFPQPDSNAKRRGDEEEEEELSEDMPLKVAVGALKDVMVSPFAVTKLSTLAKKRKGMSQDEFKREADKVKSEIMMNVYKSSGAALTLGAFMTQSKLGKLLAKALDKLILKVMVHGGETIDPSIILKTLSSTLLSVGSVLGMGDELEGDPLIEADVTKGKEFKTKGGAVKKSPKDKGTGLPKKYVSGLSSKQAKLRKQRLAKRASLPDSDPKAWDFVNPKEKNMKTKPSKYNALYAKLKKKGKLKAIKSHYEHDLALQRIVNIDESDRTVAQKLSAALSYAESCHDKGMTEACELVRAYVDMVKEEREWSVEEDTKPIDINEEFDYLLLEVSPPSGPARRFSKKEKVKADFRKRYGKDWKRVFYATAWKMHGAESYEPDEKWLEESKKIESVYKWTSLGKRGPLLIGTDKIDRTYRFDTPGERERLKEAEAAPMDDEKRKLYKEWEKLVNMSAKELSNFIDSEEGEEAGLSRKEAGKAGSSGGKIKSGRDSARAIVRMLERPMAKWSENDWEWAGRQVNFINRMKGAKGPTKDEDGKPTRKTLALKIWGHDPEK